MLASFVNFVNKDKGMKKTYVLMIKKQLNPLWWGRLYWKVAQAVLAAARSGNFKEVTEKVQLIHADTVLQIINEVIENNNINENYSVIFEVKKVMENQRSLLFSNSSQNPDWDLVFDEEKLIEFLLDPWQYEKKRRK